MADSLKITVNSAELSSLLTRAYDAGYLDAVQGGHDLVGRPRWGGGAHLEKRAHRLFELIRDWSFERRLRAIAAAGPIVKEGNTDA